MRRIELLLALAVHKRDVDLVGEKILEESVDNLPSWNFGIVPPPMDGSACKSGWSTLHAEVTSTSSCAIESQKSISWCR
jgi:hypothetical protein